MTHAATVEASHNKTAYAAEQVVLRSLRYVKQRDAHRCGGEECCDGNDAQGLAILYGCHAFQLFPIQ